MSSSEDDYMSDAFLTGCVQEDIRPGLLFSRSDKRDHEILKKKNVKDEVNKISNPSKSRIESESRENALNQPIGSDNKGFTMLQKLGFKPGSGLGKSSTGRTEPVPIKLKTGRQGLGRAEALKEIAQIKANLRKEVRSKFLNIENYRLQLAEKAAEKRTVFDLRKSQRICQKLDTDSGISEPDEDWFWPNYERKEADDNDKTGVDDFDDGDKSHWDDNDTSKRKETHEDDDGEEGDDVSNEELENKEEECEEYTIQEKLEMLTLYLRETYFYCIWCAVQYDDDRDLRKECPGPTYEDH